MPVSLRLVRAGFAVGSRLAPRLAGRAAEQLFFRPPRFEPPAREADWLASAERRRVTVGRNQVAVYTWGHGRPVALVHGWAGRAGQMGALATTLADAGMQAIAFDAPAHGDSSGRRSNAIQFIDALWRVTADVGPLAGVVGHSMGSAVSAVAVAEGLVAERVVLISSPTLLKRIVASFAETIGITPEVEQIMRQRLQSRVGPEIWRRYSPLHVAPHIDAPTLVVHDVEDDEIPLSEARTLADAFPEARLLCTAGLGHTRILRDPKVVTAVATFLSNTNSNHEEKSHA
ncbi:MAG: alpha/beta fold hydrolase [Myxococcota bacterium]